MFNLNDLHKITSILSPSGLLEHFKKLLGAYEEKVEENGELKKENQDLKDRLRKLIGEQEVPKFKPKKIFTIHDQTKKTVKKIGKRKARKTTSRLTEKSDALSIKKLCHRTPNIKVRVKLSSKTLLLKLIMLNFKLRGGTRLHLENTLKANFLLDFREVSLDQIFDH